MAKAWVICPIVRIGDGNTRVPKIDLLKDPGRQGFDEDTGERPNLGYWYSCVPHDTDDSWVLCYVTGTDFTNLINDPDVIVLHDFTEGDLTTRTTTLSNQKRNNLKTKLRSKKITVDLDSDRSLHEVIVDIGKQRRPSFSTTIGTWVKEP